MIKIVPRFRPSVRYVNGLVIYFKSKELVYVEKGKDMVCFMRWFCPKGQIYEKSWKPFCERLCRNNSISTIWQVIALANHYGIESYKPYWPEEIPKKILVRPSVFKEKRNKK